MKHDIKIFFGDLNFRIDLSYESVLSTINSMTDSNYEDQLHAMLSYDQLNTNRVECSWMGCFKEMPIHFLPTYKYDKKSKKYDTSAKKRVPSWTDRILWYFNDEDTKEKESKFIHPLFYERRESIFSDHRPV